MRNPPYIKFEPLIAVCHDCNRQHAIDVAPGAVVGEITDWAIKHNGHNVEYRRAKSRKRWEDYPHNANLKLSYGASFDAAITLASLATDSNLLVGRQSDAIDNRTNLYLDYLASKKVTTGTSPTASREIDSFAVGCQKDTTWPDAFGASDAARTITNADIKNGICRPLAAIGTSSSSNVTYSAGPVSIASIFGGIVPQQFVLFVTHNTAVNLHATGSNHAISLVPTYMTSA